MTPVLVFLMLSRSGSMIFPSREGRCTRSSGHDQTSAVGAGGASPWPPLHGERRRGALPNTASGRGQLVVKNKHASGGSLVLSSSTSS
jgi:hypothetical protein